MYDVTPTPPPSESSSQTSSPSHSSRSDSFISQDMSSHSSQNESFHTSQDGSLHSSDFETSHSTTPPHLSNQSSAGSLPNSSSPVRLSASRLPPNLPMRAELKPTWSFMPTARPIYSQRSNYVTHMHGGMILYRPPFPSAPPMETSQPPRTPEVSAKGIISPPRSITSSLSSLSPLPLTPPLSPPSTSRPSTSRPSTSLPAALPAKPLTLTSASLSRLSSGPTHCKSLPLLNETSSFPPTFSSDSQATMLPAYESLKKSVSEPNFEN